MLEISTVVHSGSSREEQLVEKTDDGSVARKAVLMDEMWADALDDERVGR
jgi:hypothetical protein